MAARGDVQLAIGYWLVSHKDTLRKWWAITLMAFTAISIIWGLVFSIVFFAQSAPLDRSIAQAGEALGWWSRTVLHGPADLTAGAVTVIARDSTHVDVVAKLNNDNAEWGAPTVRLHFVVDGQALPSQTTFLNPATQRPVFAFNQLVKDSTAAKASVVIETVDWTRATAASLPAADFSIDNVTISPTTVTTNGQVVNTVSIRAAITNRSVYSFRHVSVPIVLRLQQTVVAVSEVTTDAWPTLTSKTITSTWAYPVSGQPTAELVPQISRFDTDNIYR